MSDDILTGLADVTAVLRSGQLNLGHYLEQLEARFIARENNIRAFLSEDDRFERLYYEANQLAQTYPEPENRPPLYGVPVGVKDIIHVHGFVTRAGTHLPVELLAGPEASCVTRLKEAGALIFGKTVTTEFAYFAPGITHNPHRMGYTPGGSSSGSAAAVGGGLCPLTLGTQTIGSIIRPAAYCGVVGFKPTFGRMSTNGILPLSRSLDQPGFFTSDVAGAELAAAHLCLDWQGRPEKLEQPILGIPAGPYLQKAGNEGATHFREIQHKLREAGFDIRPIKVMADFEEIAAQHYVLLAAEAAEVHREWFEQYAVLYHPKTAALLEGAQYVTDQEVQECRAGREELRRRLTTLMAEHDLSVWLAPSAPGTAPVGLDSTGDPVMNLPWSYAGLPVINLPAGRGENGLPLGLQVVGGWSEDEKLLGWAAKLEEVLTDM